MTLASTLHAGALGASAVLGMELRWRGITLLALLASLLELGLALGAVAISIRGVPLQAVLGAVLVGAGALCWRYAPSKIAVSASTVVMMAGAVPVLAAWL